VPIFIGRGARAKAESSHFFDAFRLKLRDALTPTPRQPGMDEPEASSATPPWSWARLLKRVVALALGPCPLCRQGARRISAAITQAEGIRKMRHPLQRAADPPPLAPARVRHATCDGGASAYAVVRRRVGAVRAAQVSLPP